MDDLRQHLQDALLALLAGDGEPFRDMWSANDDVAIMGAWGGVDQGWAELGPRLDWASGRFSGGGTVVLDPVASWMGEDLAVLVDLERKTGERDGRTMDSVIRCTHVFRRESGEWRLVLRHADDSVEATSHWRD